MGGRADGNDGTDDAWTMIILQKNMGKWVNKQMDCWSEKIEKWMDGHRQVVTEWEKYVCGCHDSWMDGLNKRVK